jgi:hypothetical protein
MLNALLTGRMAGLAAARQTSSQAYLRECHRALAGPFRAAALFRAALRWGWAGALTRLVPGNWLFHLTRAVDFRLRAG